MKRSTLYGWQPIDYIGTFLCVLITVAFIVWALTLGAMKYYELESAKEPQLYTVHFDGIDYQDLELIRSINYGSIYRTKAGKRIEFHGNFYEVEQ